MFINILLTKTWIPLASKMNFKGARGLTRKITLLIDLYLPRSLERRQGIELLRIKFSSFPVYNVIDLRYKYPLPLVTSDPFDNPQ